MRGFVLLWASGTVLAILVTAGAFLLLANLSTSSPEKLEPGSRPTEPDQPLQLSLDKEQLASLSGKKGQKIKVKVSNEGDETLSEVKVAVKVLSEDTSVTSSRDYEATLYRLEAGGYETAEMKVDLSPLASPERESSTVSGEPDPPRKVVQIRATTPGSADKGSAVTTVVLPS